MRRCLFAVIALAVLASACSPPDGGGDGVVLLEGALERRDGREWVPVDDPAIGDVVRATTATAVLGVGPDQLTLLVDSEVRIDDDAVVLSVGSVVVDGQAVTLRVGAAEVDGVGAFRVDAGVTPRVGVYAGTAEVRRPGEGQRLDPYRQLPLSSRRFDGLDLPLSYEAADPVDQRLLAKAINFDQEVARYSARLAELYGDQPRPTAFYTSFVEVADDDVDVLQQVAPVNEDSGAVGPPAEALIALFIARALSGDDPEELRRVAARIAELRGQGARWGLIAMVLDLREVTFGATVDQAVAARQVVEAALPAAPAPAGGPAPAPPSTGGDAAAPGPQPAPPPPPQPPPPPPAPPPEQGLVPEPLRDVIDEVLDTVPTDLGAVVGQ